MISKRYNEQMGRYIAKLINESKAKKTNAVRHGRWNDDGSCSVCGHCDWDFMESKYFRYCPNCGADMREVRE